MRPAEIAAVHAEAVRTLLAIGGVVDPRIVDPVVGVAAAQGLRRLALVIAEQRNGYSSGGFDPIGGGFDGTSTTETAALAPDSAAQALHDLERTVRVLQRACGDLAHLNAMWAAAPRRALCAHCGDPSGSHAREFCRWCASWLADTHKLPPMEEVVARQTGARRNARRPKPEAA